MYEKSHTAETVYEKPTLERFGSFRELTLIGPAMGNDIASVFGLSAGCNPDTDDPDYACRYS
ncbi:MAG TPA: lasso RiPP family leader peptide-containing protein [Thermomicrobiales bacterium]|nr:lasso RiPP family leader peptide-containing protein [Thermomicrobiales bacterium]